MIGYIPFNIWSIILVILISLTIGDRAFSDTIVHVDNQNPSASDSNPGSESAPLKTLNKAVQLAEASNKQSVPVTVYVHAGTYRESVAFNFSNTSKPSPITFEAVPSESVVISGSDIWTGWQRQGTTNVYTNTWPYNWGVSNRGATHPPIVGRREMVFINGVLLKQVLSSAALVDESFYVDEAADTIYIRTNTDVKAAKIEVAIRSGLFVVNSRKNMTLKGFVFQHDTSSGDASAVRIENSSGILVEDCDFLWNGWGGLRIYNFNNAVIRRTVANHNGGRGTEAGRGTNLISEDNETSYNNWRGFSGGYTGHNVAGAKHLRIHGAEYKNQIALENKARGFWLDFDSQDVIFDGLILLGNLEAGIGVEANQGPIVIRSSAICNNTTYGGIISSNSENVTVLDSVIYNNTNTQLRWYGAAHSRPVNNWETGQTYNLHAKNWTVRGNIIAGTTSKQLLMYVTDSPADLFLNTLTANNNIYWNPFIGGFRADGDINFNGWKIRTGEDSNSVFADPETTNITAKQRELLDICMNQDVSIFSVTASAITPDSAEITWTTSQPADSRVEYGPTQAYGSQSPLDPALVTQHKVSLTGLSQNTTYHFRVISKDQSGTTHTSNDFTFATPQAVDNIPPTAPTVLTAIVISSTQINLSWGASSDNVGVTGYRVYRNGSAIYTGTQTFYPDTGLAPSAKYTYTVTAFDAAGNESEHSEEASATTYADPSTLPPAAPSNLEVDVPQP
jgi:chitodextrinase